MSFTESNLLRNNIDFAHPLYGVILKHALSCRIIDIEANDL